MTQWPPTGKKEEKTPRKLRYWRFTLDGPLWGGLLIFIIWASVIAVITSSTLQGWEA